MKPMPEFAASQTPITTAKRRPLTSAQLKRLESAEGFLRMCQGSNWWERLVKDPCIREQFNLWRVALAEDADEAGS